MLHQSILLSDGVQLGVDSLAPDFAVATPSAVFAAGDDGGEDLPFAEAKQHAVQAFTVAYLKRRLAQAGGNITRAADASGLLRPNFRRLMKQFDVGAPHGDEGEDDR